MSIARTHHTKDYTCMSNYHFRDKTLSLKAKGLLSLMLSLPGNWNYSVAGLAELSSDGETSVRTAVKELEDAQYLQRTPIRENGRIIDWEYDIYEKPVVEIPQVEIPLLENKDNKIHKQTNIKKVNKTNSKELVENFELIPKPKKDNLYTKCVSLINDFTTNDELHSALVDYLQVRLEMKDKPLYANSWKGLLNKLNRDFGEHERLAVVRQSIERGYASFFPVSTYRKNNFGEQGIVKSVQYTDEQREHDKQFRERLEKEGKQVVF